MIQFLECFYIIICMVFKVVDEQFEYYPMINMNVQLRISLCFAFFYMFCGFDGKRLYVHGK